MEWTILQTIVYIVTFLITVIGFGIKLSTVIQKNTQAINTLTDKLKELTEDNKKEHESFKHSIDDLKEDVTIFIQKHSYDIKILEKEYDDLKKENEKEEFNMEDLLNFVSQYAVFPIAIICFVVGYIIKHFIPKLPNKFIPLILAILGLFLNIAFSGWKFNFDIAVTGLCSGIVATGSFELVRNLLSKSDKETESSDKKEEIEEKCQTKDNNEDDNINESKE